MSEEEERNDASSDKKGVKLPYFHRKLSAEDEALIGDITPKPISAPSSQESSSKKESTSTKVTEGSAWNAANTWEERDTTSWGKQKLTEVFSSGKGENKVKISKIEKIEGNSSVTHVRGRARFLYEWGFTVTFEISGLMGSFKGSAKVSDVINDQLSDIEIEVTWSNPRPTVLDSRMLQGHLKEEIINRVKIYEEEFKNISK